MMIRHPLALRLDPNHSARDQIHEAARLGARGVVLDAIGELAPHRLSETGRREMRHVLSTVELALVALSLPTRRPFDTTDQLDDRVRRAEAPSRWPMSWAPRSFWCAAGAVPPGDEPARREVFADALRELGTRAEHRGVRLALETGSEPAETLKSFLETMALPGLAASIDPAAGLQTGIDPIASRARAGRVGRSRLCQRRDPPRPAFGCTEPARIRISSRCPRLGRVSRCISKRSAIAAS